MWWTAHTQAPSCLIATHLLQNLHDRIWYTHSSTARGSCMHVLRSRFLIGKILPLIAWFVLRIYRGSKGKDMDFQGEQFMLWHKCRNNVLKISSFMLKHVQYMDVMLKCLYGQRRKCSYMSQLRTWFSNKYPVDWNSLWCCMSNHICKICSQIWLEIHCFFSIMSGHLSWPIVSTEYHTGTTETRRTQC